MQIPAESPLSQDVVWLDRSSVMATDQAQPTEFTIGELAKEFGVTLRALRFYENKGLIGPRRDGMTRLYNQSDRDRLALILTGKKLGFTLSEIRQMVASENGRDGKALQLSHDDCLEQIGLLERQKADIEEGLVELRRIQALLRSKGADPCRRHPRLRPERGPARRTIRERLDAARGRAAIGIAAVASPAGAGKFSRAGLYVYVNC